VTRATFPTADHRDLRTGKYQLGPAATMIYYGVNNWQIGGTLVQSWSFAGNGDRDDVSEFTWSYDFKDNEGWTIPLGFQVGRITQIGRYKYNLSMELLWVPKQDGSGPSPERGVKLVSSRCYQSRISLCYSTLRLLGC
jgi:hypothetical protein